MANSNPENWTAKEWIQLIAPCNCTMFDRTHERIVHFLPNVTQLEIDHLRTELLKHERGCV